MSALHEAQRGGQSGTGKIRLFMSDRCVVSRAETGQKNIFERQRKIEGKTVASGTEKIPNQASYAGAGEWFGQYETDAADVPLVKVTYALFHF